jgi:ribosome biogenesis protein YTM1
MDQQVTVKFVTKDIYERYRIDDSPLAIPRKLGRHGLSEVINHLLGLESAPQPFDFSINDELIREPMSSFILSRNLSVEDILVIEYFPAYSLSEEKQTVETDAWVGCMGINVAKSVLVAGCYDGSLQILPCTASASKVATKFTAHEDPIRSLALWDSTDVDQGTILATASKDQSVKIWKLNSAGAAPLSKGKKRDIAGAEKDQRYNFVQMASLSDHSASVEALAYYSNVQASVRDMLFSGDWSGNIFAWDVTPVNGAEKEAAQTLSHVMVNRAHNQVVSGLQISQASGSWRMYSCSWDHSLKEWDVERQDPIAALTSDSKVFTSLHFNESSRIIGTSHNDGKIRLWDVRSGMTENSCLKISNSPSTQWVSSFRWHPDESLSSIFATTDYAGVLRMWDVRATSTPLDMANAHDGKALCCAWLQGGADEEKATPSARSLYSGGSDCQITHQTFGA